MNRPSRSLGLARCIGYGVAVFIGSASLGLAILPAAGRAVGYPIEPELLTLKAVPYLFGMSVGSGLMSSGLLGKSFAFRSGVCLGNTVLVYIIGATLAALPSL